MRDVGVIRSDGSIVPVADFSLQSPNEEHFNCLLFFFPLVMSVRKQSKLRGDKQRRRIPIASKFVACQCSTVAMILPSPSLKMRHREWPIYKSLAPSRRTNNTRYAYQHRDGHKSRSLPKSIKAALPYTISKGFQQQRKKAKKQGLLFFPPIYFFTWLGEGILFFFFPR